jgi:murein DD-endopeptidase MepM/ murein hydrolase activator NlpD
MWASDTLRSPLQIPIALSASYGELRPNHFHAGLDFKTEQRCGLPVYAVEDGYVSRIKIAQFGYGNCLYITHPLKGFTTVYAHLDDFNDTLKTWIKDYQYQVKSFRLTCNFPIPCFP